MAEFRLGRLKFNWTGAWQANRAYVLDDIISFKGNTYVCVVNHTSAASQEAWEDTDLNASPARWELYVPGVRNAGAWTANTFYARQDLVRYGGNIYICKDNHTSPNNENLFYVTNFAGNWDLFLNGNENKGDWAQNTWYKINDLVKYGNNIYLCFTGHTSTLTFDPTKFSVYLESVKFEDSWSSSVEYQPGDIVLFGGYSYAAKTIHTNKQPNQFVNTDWEAITVGFDAKGAYSPSTVYVPGDVVRFGGNTFVKLITSAAGIDPDESGDGAVKWGLITEGLAYKGAWIPGTTYQKNDVVTSGTSTFISTLYDNVNVDPAAPGASSNWSLLSAGAEAGTITQKGDLLYRATATNARLAIGDPGQILYASELGIPTWGNNKSRRVYFVTLDGVDNYAAGYGQSIGRAFRTVKYAVETATSVGCGEETPATVYVKAGVYNELCPIIVPPYCSIVGDDSRGTIIQPDLGLEARPDGSVANPYSKIFTVTIATDWVYIPGDTVSFSGGKTGYVLHFTDAEGSPVGTQLKRRAYILQTGGATDIAIGDTFTNGTAPGSPTVTIQNSVKQENGKATLFFLSEGVMLKDIVFNNQIADGGFVAPPVDPALDPDEDEVEYDEQAADIRKANIGFVFFRIAPNLIAQKIIKSPYIYSCASYCKKGVGALVDGSINEPRIHPNYATTGITLHGHQSMLFGNVTQFPEGGCAIWDKDNGNSEIVSCFTYYSYIGYAATNGARIRSLAGNNSWGSYGSIARGFDPVEVPLEGTVRGSELILPQDQITGSFQVGSIISNEAVWSGTGSSSGTTLTIGTLARGSGLLRPGASIKGNGIPEGVYIVSQLTGTTGQVGTYQLSAALPANLSAGSAIAGETPLNSISITGFSGNGTTGTITFDPIVIGQNNLGADVNHIPFENGKTIVVTGSSNANLNTRAGFVVTNCTATSVSFFTAETTGTGGAVKPATSKAELLYITEFDLYRKFLIEPITGYIGNWTRVGQITSNTAVTEYPSANPAPVAYTISPLFHSTDEFFNTPLNAANRQIRGAKFPVLNLTEKPKITSAVTFNGDNRNYVIQEVESYSATAPAALKIANVTRTKFFSGSTSSPTIPIARTGTFVSPVITPAAVHFGGTDVTLFNLLPDTSAANFTDIDNEGATLTSTTDTNINLLDASKVAAAKALYDTADTELFMLVGNEIMKPITVVSNQFDSYVTVLRGQEGTIAQEHADQDSPSFPQNARVRFLVKHTPVTTLRQDLTNLNDTLTYSAITKNGGITFFDFTSDTAVPNTLYTIEVGDFVKIDQEFFKIDLKQTPNPGSAILTFYPAKPIPESSGTPFFIRYRYSQIRLTGHDMLEIGTGGVVSTNFPDEPQIRPKESRETNFVAPARIYYVTTNQDGNFKVGEFFRVDQATGKTNIDASQISLVGVGAIQFGSSGALVGSSVEKFDPDPGILASENASDQNVPTQLAVRTYVENNFLNKLDDPTIGTISQGANLTVFGSVDVKADLVVEGDLTVNGTTTTINTNTLDVEDKNIILANSTSPTDALADGGGITLLGDTNKTITWLDSTDNWTFSESIDVVTGKDYKINNVAVLTASAIHPTTATVNIAAAGTNIQIGATTGTTSVRNSLILPAGTTTLAPAKLTNGVLLTNPETGSVEYASNLLYATPSANATLPQTSGPVLTGPLSGRGYVPTVYHRRLFVDRTGLKNNLGATAPHQPENIFAAASGAVSGGFQLTPQTLYKFRSLYYVQGSSTTAVLSYIPLFNHFVGTGTWTNTSSSITIATITHGAISIGTSLVATGITPGTVITGQTSGTPGGTGTYTISANTISAQTGVAINGTPGANLMTNVNYTMNYATTQNSYAYTNSYFNSATAPVTGTNIPAAVANNQVRTIIMEGQFYHNGQGATPVPGILYPQISKNAPGGAGVTMSILAGTYFELTPVLSGAAYPTAAANTAIAGAGRWY